MKSKLIGSLATLLLALAPIQARAAGNGFYDYSNGAPLLSGDVLLGARLNGVGGCSAVSPATGCTFSLGPNDISTYIRGTLPASALSGSYTDLINLPNIPSLAPVQTVAGRAGTVVLSTSDISGYVAPVNPDWTAASGLAKILNKPTSLSQFTNDLTGTPSTLWGFDSGGNITSVSVGANLSYGAGVLTAIPGGSYGDIQFNSAGTFGAIGIGNGITISGGVLNTTQPADRLVSITTDTILASDNRRYVIYQNVSPTAVTVPSASSPNFTQGFGFFLRVPYGSGLATLTSPGSTFNGASSLAIPGGTVYLHSDGTNWTADTPVAVGLTGSIQYSSAGSLAGASITGLVKGNGTATPTAAVSGTDYAPATSGSSVLKGNGSGGFINSKTAITEPATTSTLTIADGKTFTSSNTITLSGTDGATLAIGAGGTLGPAAYLANFTGGLTFQIGCAPGATVPPTGSYGFRTMPYSGTFTTWYIAGDTSGSAIVDIKRSGTSIVGSGNKPTLSGAQFGNAALSGWTSTSFSAGDQIEIVLSSVSTLECVTGVIQTNRTN